MPIFGVIFGIILITTVGGTTLLRQQAEGIRGAEGARIGLPAHSVTSGENVYIVWASNKTGTPDVMHYFDCPSNDYYHVKTVTIELPS